MNLLDYVYERWGEEHVAMIGSFVTMHARLAIREIAKVFGVPPGEVNHFTKRLPHRPVREILQAIRDLPECRDFAGGRRAVENDSASGACGSMMRRGTWGFIRAGQ